MLLATRFANAALWIVLGAALIALAFAGIGHLFGSRDGSRHAGWAGSNADIPQLPEPSPQLIKPLSREEAMAANAAVPFSTERVEPARPFVVSAEMKAALGRKAAVDCLTAAIYYEAASESAQGQRAVAQVVLNRVRHPAFPRSICEVVYQGSERVTGCQFSFTCDGSLNRKPSRQGWDQAFRVAESALSGTVEPSVGMATHYHTDWVVPYWASDLTKITAIGTHIFYRWRGYWGTRQAFTQAYAGDQTGDMAFLPSADVLESESTSLGNLPTSERPFLDRLLRPPPAEDRERNVPLSARAEVIADEPTTDLLIDERKFDLTLDDDAGN